MLAILWLKLLKVLTSVNKLCRILEVLNEINLVENNLLQVLISRPKESALNFCILNLHLGFDF